MDEVTERLALWKRKHNSFGGRVVLLNSVHANIPTYLLYLYKAPKKVLAKLVNLQRRFLWGNKRGDKGIVWVSWAEVCKPKSLGGLWVKNLAHFNDALLGKWKWHSLQDNESSKEIFPRLFTLAINRDASDMDCGDWINDVSKWEVV
ncbi:hypothetical protein Lal_00048502 [Lupinus albus]|nr:hypothetical protein Lal_00048502 [Lupinus albus]